ncbi:hypothetical protein D3C87_1351510 [compost metagenome]
MKKLLLVLALGLGFTSTSHADLMVEPYIGYEMGSGSLGSDDFKVTSTDLGLRLGYHSGLMFWGALDYTMGSGTIDPDTGDDQDGKRSTLAAVIGVDLPILLRAWVGYGFTNEMKLDSDTLKGKATKIGVGFTALPFVSLNLEVISDEWDETSSGGDPDAKNTSYLVSVSLPLNF